MLGHSSEATYDTNLRRMPSRVHCIVSLLRHWLTNVSHLTKSNTRSSCSWRGDTLKVPDDQMQRTLQKIFTPFIWRMMQRRRRTLGAL